MMLISKCIVCQKNFKITKTVNSGFDYSGGICDDCFVIVKKERLLKKEKNEPRK
jgi:hypothetical protein